ncbi:MAG TPA: HAMP domain-containing sensor histidine kinase [Bdellovibrionota bacterium]|nr:HAMP domain-containing sensor histidine kinase [Bdellovibrionota bacterium]
MSGKGGFTYVPNRRLRWMVAAHGAWLAIVCALGAWWWHLLLKQATRISELEQAAGLAQSEAHAQWEQTQRMLFWESGTYFALLLVATGLIIFMYLRDARRARGLEAFFASVTHELRTPLTSIRLQAETIAENLSQADRTLVNRLLEDTLRLESQVERTLELARVEGGGPVLRSSIQLKPWLQRFVQNSLPSGIELELDVPEDLEIEADPAGLQVILRNLIENSLRHSRTKTLKATLKAEQREKAALLFFSDNGGGFEGKPTDLGQLFRKGAQSHGAGVGLYLIRMLMDRMGGKAEFDGGPGFEVRLSFEKGGARG